MRRIRSATELSAVHVEDLGNGCSEVWLYDNIAETLVEDEYGSQVFWDADSVNAVVAGVPSEDEIEAAFEDWWNRLEEASLTDAERFEKLEAQVLFTALMTDTEV
ncbi:MAG: hypothetical protein IJ111_07770 [Eggerthellaceae bacterium]|nr:hypothetical protein [Eggerthellaceae bacterium]